MDPFQRLHLLQICVSRFKSLIVSCCRKEWDLFICYLLRIVTLAICQINIVIIPIMFMCFRNFVVRYLSSLCFFLFVLHVFRSTLHFQEYLHFLSTQKKQPMIKLKLILYLVKCCFHQCVYFLSFAQVLSN